MNDWEQKQGRVYALGEAIPAGMELERRRPARDPHIADVIVTGAYAFGTFGVLVFAGVILTVITGIDDWLIIGAAVGMGALVLTWLFWMAQNSQLLYQIERRTNLDVNRDGVKGKPPAQPAPSVRVEVVEPKERHMAFLDLPGEPAVLVAFARGVMGGRSLAESGWTGRGGLFSVSEYRQLRDVLIERGLGRWRNPSATSQGWELSAKGRAVLGHLAKLRVAELGGATTPLPDEG